ncbi:uncharacterized protein V6R79_012192 [Siganus canaliculatus]
MRAGSGGIGVSLKWYHQTLFFTVFFFFFFFSLQSLKELLEEQLNSTPHVSSEELETGDKDGNSEQTEFGAPDQQLWDSSDSNAALVSKESLLARLLKDLMRTSKRSWSRYKKGAMRSCFGVRLERIGSFSGLGC